MKTIIKIQHTDSTLIAFGMCIGSLITMMVLVFFFGNGKEVACCIPLTLISGGYYFYMSEKSRGIEAFRMLSERYKKKYGNELIEYKEVHWKFIKYPSCSWVAKLKDTSIEISSSKPVEILLDSELKTIGNMSTNIELI